MNGVPERTSADYRVMVGVLSAGPFDAGQTGPLTAASLCTTLARGNRCLHPIYEHVSSNSMALNRHDLRDGGGLHAIASRSRTRASCVVSMAWTDRSRHHR
jgi:hypothetical protein